MTIIEMQNRISHLYGLESEVTIMFYDYCKNHSEKEISSFYTMCLAIPYFDEEE
jgi:hypothetical protein